MGRWRQRVEQCIYEPKNPKNWRKSLEARKEACHRLSLSLEKEPTLPISWFQTSGLQDCEGMNFCCFKPCSLWYFGTAALRIWYMYLVKHLWYLTCTCGCVFWYYESRSIWILESLRTWEKGHVWFSFSVPKKDLPQYPDLERCQVNASVDWMNTNQK